MNYEGLLNAQKEIGNSLTKICITPKYNIGDNIVLPYNSPKLSHWNYDDNANSISSGHKWHGKVVSVEISAILSLDKIVDANNSPCREGYKSCELIYSNKPRRFTFY
jgi:hypothetical protein